MKTHTRYFHVAGITIQVNSDFPITSNTFHPKFKRFEVPGPGIDNVTIYHHFEMPESYHETILNAIEVFKNDQFQIYKSDHLWIYQYTAICSEDLVSSAIGTMNRDYSEIHIHTRNVDPEQYAKGYFPALTLFNTDQMIFAKLLTDRNGLMIHANGFNINGNGILLAGVSGSGKSTLSRMLKDRGHEILCDDRMLLRKKDGRFWIFGNWCYGSHPDVSSGCAPLKGFLFLEKSLRNRITDMRDQKTVMQRLLQVLVKPLLDSDGWQKYFTTIEDLLNNDVFFLLEFDLSGNIRSEIMNYFGVCNESLN